MSEEVLETNVKGKVLIAEDDDSMRRFLEVTLKRQNYEVFPAKDGLEAMEIALNNEINVIVTDAIMPNLTGYDLCRILRQNPDKKHIPLIILSGFDQNDEANTDKNLADVYLKKDNNLKEILFDTLETILANS
jgi:DNA-binding response OmpR family regulator